MSTTERNESVMDCALRRAATREPGATSELNEILRTVYGYAHFVRACADDCVRAPREGLTVVNRADVADNARETASKVLSYVPRMHASELTAPMRALAAYGALAGRVAERENADEQIGTITEAASRVLSRVQRLDPAMWSVYTA